MEPRPTKRQIPASFGKYFKTTQKAQRLMDPESRICPLDRDSHTRELVYCTHSEHEVGWDEMSWTQARLWDAAQSDPSRRVVQRNLGDMMSENTCVITDADMLGDRYAFDKFKDGPIKLKNDTLTKVKLGYAQRQRECVYLISKKVDLKELLATYKLREEQLDRKGG